MRLWPDTLAGRTLTLLIGMTLLLIVGSAILLHDERHARFDERNLSHLLERVGTLTRVLGDADESERQRIIRHAAHKGDNIDLSDQPQVAHPPRHPLEHKIARKLNRDLNLGDRSAVRVQAEFRNRDDKRGDRAERDDTFRKSHHPRARVHDLKCITIAVRLWDGTWLNFRTKHFENPPPWAGKTLQLLALLLTLIVISGLFIARRMARPMAQLAKAAERFGLEQSHRPLAEKGPREVRHTIRAFNQMQDRLHRHITERSQMLAAIAHDLRTPITALRLRAEYIEDPEIRDKTLATLREMEAILSATLGFARDDAADETSRATDLAALLQSMVDDHADLGHDTDYTGPDHLTVNCRPVALKRALNNLIDNALKYGQRAHVRLLPNDGTLEIRIEDQGPGIPPEQLDAVFAPFYRVETSRNRDTGGTGLGLAVARTIVLAHGGQLHLENLPAGGLSAIIKLPQ